MKMDYLTIATAGKDLTWFCHGQALANGWWTELGTGKDLRSKGYPLQQPIKNVGELIALAHSELSEALEAHRKLLMDDKLPDRTGLEVELADCVIRIFDIAGGLGLDVAGASASKLEFNASRDDHRPASRREANGKKF